MTDLTLFNPTIPSLKKALLKKMIGKRIIEVTTCTWDVFEDSDPDEVWNVSRSDYFQMNGGSLVISLENGHEIGFFSDESVGSIWMWQEKDESGGFSSDYFRNDCENILISNDNPEFASVRFQKLTGKMIKAVSILHRAPQNAKFVGLPNEAGIELTFESGDSLILSHNLFHSVNSFGFEFREHIKDKSILIHECTVEEVV